MVAGLASAVPANLSHAPISGILGVVLGAGVVTLAGRLASSFAVISLIWSSRSTTAALSAADPDIPIFIAAKTEYAKL